MIPRAAFSVTLALVLVACATAPAPTPGAPPPDPALVERTALDVIELATTSNTSDSTTLHVVASTPASVPLSDAVTRALRELGYSVSPDGTSAWRLSLDASPSDAVLVVTFDGTTAARLYTRSTTGQWDALAPFTLQTSQAQP